MYLRTSNRSKVKLKMAIQGPSGCGKTYSALLIAFGITNNWNKIAVIDTENNSADLYAHLGSYKVLALSAPFTPERYIEALQMCLGAGIEVAIIDSISHEWAGSGGILELHSSMKGNSFTNWSKLTPRHNAFIQFLIQANIHVIATMRTKQDYIMIEREGKLIPEKIGMKFIQRKDTEFEFTLVLNLNTNHIATVSKDRTGLFIGKPAFTPNKNTGLLILNWCQLNTNVNCASIEESINACQTTEALKILHQASPQYHISHALLFTQKKQSIQVITNK